MSLVLNEYAYKVSEPKARNSDENKTKYAWHHHNKDFCRINLNQGQFKKVSFQTIATQNLDL
jgi:hypothetical protein